MPREPLSYLALNGSLGTGFKEESLEAASPGRWRSSAPTPARPTAVPTTSGTGEWIWSTTAYERDLRLGLLGARRLGVPLIIGSCGGGGNDSAVEGYAEMVDRIANEHSGCRCACGVRRDRADRDLLVAKYRDGRLAACPAPRPRSTRRSLRQPGHIVAMSGAEPSRTALDDGADVVLLGRCADAAIFAAVPLSGASTRARSGTPPRSSSAGRRSPPTAGPGLHPVHDRGRRLRARAADPALRCTPASVAAHTLYETADPYRLMMPSGTLDARAATYEALDERRVNVRGRHVHALGRLHREARRRGAGRVSLVVLGLDARPGDPEPALVVVRRDAGPGAPAAREYVG